MPMLLLTFWTFLATFFPGQEFDIKDLRALLNEGKTSKAAAENLYDKVGDYSGEDALILGYKASAWALRAKYSGNPIKKLKSIKGSGHIFSDAVNRDPQSLELRFLRYAVEAQTPKSLNLSKHLEEDEGVLLEGFRKYPNSAFTPETARIARDFLMEFCTCAEEEKQMLSQVKI
jgi:hypothetical protein